jgi:hypothetical protein
MAEPTAARRRGHRVTLLLHPDAFGHKKDVLGFEVSVQYLLVLMEVAEGVDKLRHPVLHLLPREQDARFSRTLDLSLEIAASTVGHDDAQVVVVDERVAVCYYVLVPKPR